MPKVQISVPLYMPSWLHGSLRRIKHALFAPLASPIQIDIRGERQVEWTFISSEIPQGPGEALEFGCEQAYLSLMAARKGYHVVALDLEEQSLPWKDSRVDFVCGDFLKLSLPENHFDLIINCSSVEHVGLVGRYGVTETNSDGDLQVMLRFHELLKPGGLLLMTAPCGRDAVFAPICRVYGEIRLPQLLAPFQVEREQYWQKDPNNRWVDCTRESALRFEASADSCWDAGRNIYALGCFVLRRLWEGKGPV
jgi:SAM-dependent methyltransferase